MGWRERVSPWDAWIVFAALLGMGVWLTIDHTLYPAMPTWARLVLAGFLSGMGLLLAVSETNGKRR